MTLTLDLPPELETRLTEEAERQGLQPAEYTLKVLDRTIPESGRRATALRLLQSWVDEGAEAGDEPGGDELLRRLDEDRLSDRKLFPLELKGTTW